MLVAGASLSLLAPIAAQASDVVNFDEPSRLDSKTFTNGANQDISSLKALVEELQSKIEKLDSLEAKQNEFEAGSFSETTTVDGAAVFTLFAADYALDTNTAKEALAAHYKYQMNLNTSFTGDDNLYVRIKAGNHTGNTVTKTYGTYLSSGSGGSDALKVDKIWYTFPVGENNTFWVGPKIENYYMHGTTPSIYKPVTKQFTLGGNGEAYGASTNSGAGWAYKFDNGWALSSNFVSQNNTNGTGLWTKESPTSWATQLGYTTNQWSISGIVNNKYHGWNDEYYHSTGHDPAAGANKNKTALGLRTWWRPLETGTLIPSVSLGFDTTNHSDSAAADNQTAAWFTGLTWQDSFQADDRIGIAFGQPTTNESETIDPFAFEMYYSFKVNDSITMTPAYFSNTNRAGTSGDDVQGVVLETTYKF